MDRGAGVHRERSKRQLGLPEKRSARLGATPPECLARVGQGDDPAQKQIANLQANGLVDAGYGCHNYVAEWETQDGEDLGEAFWKQEEDPTDHDPILMAQWAEVNKALRRADLSWSCCGRPLACSTNTPCSRTLQRRLGRLNVF